MKKKIKIIATLLCLVLFSSTVQAKSTMPEIKVVDGSKLIGKMLMTRKGKNIVYIERIKGVVTNNKGDGKILNAPKGVGTYISYKRVPKAKKGDKIITYCVYDPYTNYTDDIILRLDFIM